MGFFPVNWTPTQWTLYAILLGILFGVFGNLWANSISRYREEKAKESGNPINYEYEAKWGIKAFIIILVLLLFLLFFWPIAYG
jgi:H+/Cl- antiporter ClcA